MNERVVSLRRVIALRTVTTLATALALAACGSLVGGPAYERPALVVPPAATGVPADPSNWWNSFNDPVLTTYLDEALRNNQDVVLVQARMAEARATLGQNTANLYPTLDLNASATRRRASENAASFAPGGNPVSDDRQIGLVASYEIDFWGRYTRADDAARARLLAQTANKGVVQITLRANVAQAYFALRALDAQFALAERTAQTRQDNLRLQQRRQGAGVSGELDVRQAEAESAAAQATLLQTRVNRANAESALALLLGRTPAQIAQPVLARGADLSALYAGAVVAKDLPSDLLARRPDIAAAEQTLIAAHADISQARAAYFPRISLTAAVGQQSRDLSTLFDPASLFWNAIANLTQPVFRAGAIGALVAATNAREQQALAQYTQTVQAAFRDVHDALGAVDAGREVVSALELRVQSVRRALQLAELRYKNGYSSYLDVLTAQRDLAQAEIGLLDAQRSQLSATVNLYKALGGGWDAQAAADSSVIATPPSTALPESGSRS